MIIYHRSHLSREPFETAIEPWRNTKVSRRPLVPGDEVLMAYAAWHVKRHRLTGGVKSAFQEKCPCFFENVEHVGTFHGIFEMN